MASAMDVDDEEVEMASSSSSSKGDKKRFEVKKVEWKVMLIHCSASCFDKELVRNPL